MSLFVRGSSVVPQMEIDRLENCHGGPPVVAIQDQVAALDFTPEPRSMSAFQSSTAVMG